MGVPPNSKHTDREKRYITTTHTALLGKAGKMITVNMLYYGSPFQPRPTFSLTPRLRQTKDHKAPQTPS